MKREFGNLEEAVNFISTKMALGKIKDDSNNEKELLNDQENLKKIMVEKNKNVVEIRERINAIYNTIIEENPELEFSQGFLVDVGNLVAEEVEKNGITSPEQISISSRASKELLDNLYNKEYENINKGYINIENNILIEGTILGGNDNNLLDKIFDNEFKKKVNELISEAKNGNDSAILATELIEKTNIYIAGIDMKNLTDKEKRGVLAYLFRIAVIEDCKAAQEYVKKLGKQCDFDIFSENKEKIDVEKLRETFEKEVQKVNPNFTTSVEQMKKLNEGKTEDKELMEKKREELSKKDVTAEKMPENAKKESESRKLWQQVYQSFKNKEFEIPPEIYIEKRELFEQALIKEFYICSNFKKNGSM